MQPPLQRLVLAAAGLAGFKCTLHTSLCCCYAGELASLACPVCLAPCCVGPLQVWNLPPSTNILTVHICGSNTTTSATFRL
jgi:hypothetical protein